MNETLSPTEVAKEYEKKRHAVDRALSKLFQSPPDELYAPARYILEGKGKRIRPMLALFGAEAISGSSKNAMPIALAVESSA